MTTFVAEHRFKPRGTAATIFENRDPEVLVAGPAGTGKSRACLEKLHLMALLNHGMRGLIVRKTAVSLTSTALVTFRTHVLPEALAAGDVAWYGGSQQEAACYRYRNGSVINVGGMDKPTRIMSSEYDVAYVQEATELTEEDWEAITTRLRHGKVSFQQLLADCNPDVPTHWLKVRCDTGRTKMLESRHEENPVLFTAEGELTEVGASYIAKLDNLTGVRYSRLRKGLWVAAEGIIYEDYDPAVHLIDRFHVPRDWVRWWSVDFGYTNPFVCQMWAEDPDGRLYLYREIYATKRLVEDHAETILAAVTKNGEWREPKPRAIICDHDAEDRATLERKLGMSTVAAKKTVSDGIQAVQARMRAAGDGKPRIFLMRDSLVQRDPELLDAKKPTCTAEELVGYVWATAAAGKPVKDEPHKLDDHGCDAMRYAVAARDLVGRARVRFLG